MGYILKKISWNIENYFLFKKKFLYLYHKFKTGSPGHSGINNMGNIYPDLKHVLETRFKGATEIKLDIPLKFKINPDLNTGIHEIDSPVEHQIEKVYKKGNSWRMVDEFNNEWMVSKLDILWQSSLYCNILSMKDNRVTPVNRNLTL